MQEYVQSALALEDTKNTSLKNNMQVYLLPTGFNSIANFIATREPLYRQNIFQFFSRMNPAYGEIVKMGGLVLDNKSIEPDRLNHLKQLYDNVIQYYLREARRSFDIKVFKA